jgi:hypothetical protein
LTFEGGGNIVHSVSTGEFLTNLCLLAAPDQNIALKSEVLSLGRVP